MYKIGADARSLNGCSSIVAVAAVTGPSAARQRIIKCFTIISGRTRALACHIYVHVVRRRRRIACQPLAYHIVRPVIFCDAARCDADERRINFARDRVAPVEYGRRIIQRLVSRTYRECSMFGHQHTHTRARNRRRSTYDL